MAKPKLTLLLVSVMTSIFLVALDRTIISTAIPEITNEFHSLPDIGWYASAYLLTCCSFQLHFGKIYSFFAVKYVFLASSALAGIGAAGIFTGSIVCIVHAVPLEKRLRLQGLFDSLSGLASITGPLVGGAFTTSVSWRWCFYINLPLGGIAMAVIFFCLEVPDRDTMKLPLKDKLKQLDGLGTGVLIPGVVSLLLALQWGGQTYSWDDRRIIALLVLAGVLLTAFVAVQIVRADTATLPPRILKQRSICRPVDHGLHRPSIHGSSAFESGIYLLPLMLSMVLATILGGLSIQKVGYYTPFAIAGSCFMVVGAGLLTTLQPGTSESRWIGYQILYGFGLGLVILAPNLTVQAVLPRCDVPIGTSLMFFSQMLSATVIVSIGENVLDNELVRKFSGLPGFTPDLVTSGGATSLLDTLPASVRPQAVPLYNEALWTVFLIGLIVSCLSVLGAASLEWRSIKKGAPGEAPAEAKQNGSKDVEAAVGKADGDADEERLKTMETIETLKTLEMEKEKGTGEKET
ncbi:hypothetical protein SCUCBS95973_008148 [Sporothrix curviconia]|uniref:Major facilitator superfamily (MFS) profile domain-containing protein n=1 Tax=Sporothrix curviconia TaxID=1260050 RepID=A0ABP0CM23_9PEZI